MLDPPNLRCLHQLPKRSRRVIVLLVVRKGVLHLPDSLARYVQLPNCFACERKHKAIRALATKLKRTMAYEHHMMEQVLATEIIMLREPGQFQKEQPKQANSKQIAAWSQFISTPCPEAKVSSVARLERGGYCHAQDAIVYADGKWPKCSSM